MTEKQIGNYLILKQIGAGGMARVYLAVHKDVPNLKVVLKVLSSPQHAERFMQEADKLALLDRNPNICHIRHFFNHEDELVIAMEYIEGKSLEEMIAEKGRFSVDETVKIITDLLTALGSAHEQEIYHRDIKPGNIMFERDGQLKIIDFGIAKGKTDPQMTIAGTATGTPEYMAPEQFAGGEHIDYAKCDIYAVGTMMYRMLTGHPPFKGENEFVLRDAKLFEDPVPPSRLNGEIPGQLDSIILKSMDKDPGRRFASIADMKTELLKLAGKPGSPAELPAPAPTPPPVHARKAAKKRGGYGKIFALTAASIVLVTAALFAVKMMSSGDKAGDRTVPGRITNNPEPPSAADTQKVPGEGQVTPPAGGQEKPAVTGPGSVEEKPAAADTGKKEERPAAVRPTSPVVSPPPASGVLLVLSKPRNAAIYINGRLQREETPFRFERPPGQYSIRIVKVIGGKEVDHSQTVTVKSGDVITVSHNFEE